jgi:superfamily II RNA helicase
MRLEGAALALAALIGAATLGGCTAGPSPGTRQPDSAPKVDRAAASAAVLASHLQRLAQLVQAPPAEQAEILASTQHDYDIAPTPSHELVLALVLAVPGHPGFDPAHAQQLLRDVLATPETLLPSERALALLTLQSVNQQIDLTSQNQHLQAESERTDRQLVAETSRRLQAEGEENAKLRKELEDARSKLDAISRIERSLNRRKAPNSTEGSTP